MTADEQRKYWREKQRESRARRRAKKGSVTVLELGPTAPRATVVFRPPHQATITANVSCRASMEEIAALGPVRCIAFMNGVANVISLLNPQRP